MPRDYKSRTTSRKQKKTLPGYLWLLSGLAIGLFVAFIIYLDKQPETEKNFGTAVQHELEKIKQQNKKKETEKKNAPVEKKEQKFNFYTILPELEVLIPEKETRPPETKNTTNTTTSGKQPSGTKQYILQVGSFQNLNDAEKLKANLALLGISADIQHVTVNKQQWHRVRSGPYRNKNQLYKDQNLLNKNDIHGISIELK